MWQIWEVGAWGFYREAMVGATPAPDGTQVRLVPCVGLVWEGGVAQEAPMF